MVDEGAVIIPLCCAQRRVPTSNQSLSRLQQTSNLNLKLMCSDMGTDQITVCRNLQTTCELRHYDRGTLTAGFSSSLLFLCSSHLITRSPIASFLISIVSHSVNHSIISLFIHLCTDVLHQHEGHHPQTVGLGL